MQSMGLKKIAESQIDLYLAEDLSRYSLEYHSKS